MKLSRYSTAFFCLSLLIGIYSPSVYGQSTVSNMPSGIVADDIKQALITLNAGNTKEAIAAFKKITGVRPADGDAWHYLGLAYKQEGERGGARKAFRRAFELRSNRALRSFYVPAKTEQEETKEILEMRGKHIAENIEATAESLVSLISVDPKAAPKFSTQLDNLRALAEDYRNGKATDVGLIYKVQDVDERVAITSKPEAGYTGEARQAGIGGIVKLRVLFAADGKVRFPVVLQGLGYGLDERAIRAALAIKFVPARKNGRAVSQYAQINYTFVVY